MADDLGRHFAKLLAARKWELLRRDSRAVIARFGAGPSTMALMRGLASYGSRKARQLVSGRNSPDLD